MSESEEDMRFEILGPIRVNTGAREIAITAGRERTVLAMLLLHANRTVSMTGLVDALWTDRAPRDARNQLQGCVSRLRRQLAEANAAGQIITEPEGYRLQAGAKAVDLLEFRSLVAEARAAHKDGRRTEARDGYLAALALWRGPALTGIDRGTMRQTAVGLEEERARALEERIDLELALGAGSELVGELTDLVHRYPYRERLHGALMLALYRADRQTDALATYQRLRQVLVTELGQEPCQALRTLHQRVLSGDDGLRAVEPDQLRSAVPAPLPASHGLPRTVADFTGRDADLAWLLDAADQADPYAPVVLTIDGMPGVGKTCLAVHAAHRLSARYPDGQLFIDLHGHSEHHPIEPAAALDTLLRQLGVPATKIPPELDERGARWRAELSTRRVLVLLDNAASSAQVAPLLPTGAGCLALVTSRRRLLDLDGARPLSMDTLSPENAVALLERIAGQRIRGEPDAAADIAKRCGYLPLALRLAAARLAHRPRWRVQDLADRLANPHTALAELSVGSRTVADAFALSYAHLTPASQRLFRLLGLHPGEHFDAYVAAALAEVSLGDAQRLLDELVDGHLTQEPLASQYRLHDLIHTHAGEMVTATDSEQSRKEATERLLDYYLHATVAASRELEPSRIRLDFQPGNPLRPDLAQQYGRWGSGWLSVERHNLVLAIDLAAQLGFDRYAWQLTWAIWRFLYHHGHTDDLLRTHRSGLIAAERLGDENAVVLIGNYLASAYYRIGRYQEAVENVQHAIERLQQIGDRPREAAMRKNLAIVFAAWGRHRLAADEGEHAAAIARQSGDPRALATALVNLGDVYLTLGRYDAALRNSRHGLALAREVGDHFDRAIALGNLGVIRARLGHYHQARRLLSVALAMKRRNTNRYGEAETLNELGVVHRALGNLKEAFAHHQRALAVIREASYGRGECAVHNELGHTLRAAGDITAALESHQSALDCATKIQNRYGEARALDGIAACLRDTDSDDARRHWVRALRLYRDLDVPERHEVERQLAALTAV
jgi:DNA-binding SARP family transcriptional activator/tetratricopeptide (TPR) repeat protein